MKNRITLPIYAFVIIVVLLTVAFSFLISYPIVRITTIKEIGTINRSYFTITQKEEVIEDFDNKYKSFLDDEKAKFIIDLCNDFEVDPDIVVSILERENPLLQTDVISPKNENGSVDIGLFQLNDRSLYSAGGFLSRWWTFSDAEDFNPMNWKHSTYIAVQYIRDLQKTFGPKNCFYIAAGYNAGSSRAYNSYNEDVLGKRNSGDKLPSSTKIYYAPAVQNNYVRWKIFESNS